MSQSGTYLHVHGQGLVKVSNEIPSIAQRDAWMPKGDVKYYDKSAKRWFESRSEKRQWLKENGMREGGIISNPDKRWDGHTKNPTRPTIAQRKNRALRKEWIRSQGGVNGLLDRLQGGSNG